MKKETKEAKPVKSGNTIETIKTIVIAVLVTAVVAFVAGMRYADQQNQKVKAAVDEVAKTVEVQKPELKQ